MTRLSRLQSVLLVFAFAFSAQAAPVPTPDPEPIDHHKKTVVDVAVTNGFDTLVAAVKAAGLVEALSGEGPFTVFAPTDEAFAKLPAGTVENLLKPENRDQLVDILTYHVVPGSYRAAEVVQLEALSTLEGGMLDVQTTGSTVRIGEATVVSANVDASNGVVHVIDSVLLPPSH